MNAARNGHLVVRYQELHAGEGSPKSPSPTQPQQPRSSCSPDSNARDEEAEEARVKAEQRRQAAAQEMKEAEERKEREDISRRAAEAKVKDRLDRQLRQEAAERANAWAQREMEIATADRLEACENLARAEQVQNASMQKFIDAERASVEAKRILLEAMLREAEAKQEMESAQSATINARTRVQQADKRFEVANQEEMSSRYEKEKLSRELDEDIVDEEAIRQAGLAESIRRMQELRELEEQEMEERARRERHAAEERLSRERKEAERVVREQREREEKARRDEAARQQFYQKAARKEQKRCRLRDLTFFPDPYVLTWHEPRVLERFLFVSDEFDTLKFQLEESQPLTFDSIPWPILGHPRGITLEDIDWTAVEKFFSAAEKLLKEKGEYKALVEKAHRRFHPDKWRSRGILNSVLDDDLRGRLEAAGNVVAQAITPLWLKSRE
ncbi:hypothetical protein BC629DRAFT_347894 [Irpex lacteus]|nr:hypothetical protein BC629DRAFT_347894 [Irpex lacteus]